MAEDANLQGLIGSQGYGHGWFRTSDLSRVKPLGAYRQTGHLSPISRPRAKNQSSGSGSVRLDLGTFDPTNDPTGSWGGEGPFMPRLVVEAMFLAGTTAPLAAGFEDPAHPAPRRRTDSRRPHSSPRSSAGSPHTTKPSASRRGGEAGPSSRRASADDPAAGGGTPFAELYNGPPLPQTRMSATIPQQFPDRGFRRS
jgi:hypothetical protein